MLFTSLKEVKQAGFAILSRVAEVDTIWGIAVFESLLHIN